jgi:hypothetical protein
MLSKLGILLVAAVLGGGAAIGVAACGEDREGDVQFEEGTGTGTTGTAGETTPETETAAETETAPETEEEAETESEGSDDSGSGGGG